MAFISQTQLQDIFLKADTSGQKLDRQQIVQELVNRGNVIEGLNDPPKKKEGLLDKLAKRVTNVQDSFQRNPNEPLMKQHAIIGQAAGGIGDVITSGIGVLGKIGSALTPDFIENPIKGMVGGATNAVAQTPLVQGVAGAYEELKKNSPDTAASLENSANILSLFPITKAGQAGQKAIAQGVKKTGLDVAQEGASKALKESAEASVARTLNPTTIATKATTQKLAPEIIKRPLSDTLAITRKGMQEKAGAAAEVAGEAIQEAGTLAGKTKTSELIDFLQSQKQQFAAGGKVVNREGVASVDEVIDIIAQYGDEVDDEVLRSVRRIFDSEYYQGKKNIAKSTAETSTLSFKKQAADKIRGILAEAYPEVAKLNKEFTFWSGLEGVLEKTVARKTGQKNALKAVATIGGATTGNTVTGRVLGAVGFNAIASLIDSPAWGLVNAKLKNRLADALAASDLSEIGKILSIIPQQTARQVSSSDE